MRDDSDVHTAAPETYNATGGSLMLPSLSRPGLTEGVEDEDKDEDESSVEGQAALEDEDGDDEDEDEGSGKSVGEGVVVDEGVLQDLGTNDANAMLGIDLSDSDEV